MNISTRGGWSIVCSIIKRKNLYSIILISVLQIIPIGAHDTAPDAILTTSATTITTTFNNLM